MKNIIDTVVSEMADSTGLDEIKKALRIAIKASGLEFTESAWNYMMDEILYRLA